MAFSILNRKNQETGNNSSVSEIEPPEVIEPVVTVSPEITHEEISNGLDESATNEINQINVETGQSTIAETVTPQQMPSPPNTNESPIMENEIESGPEQSVTEFNAVDSTELPPAPILQRKNRRRGKKTHFQDDINIDEEFASRLDLSCADAGVPGPQIENAHVSTYT